MLKTSDTVSFSEEAYRCLEKMLSKKMSNQQSDMEEIPYAQDCFIEKQESSGNSLLENRFRSYVIRPEYGKTDKTTLAKGDGGDGNGSDGSEIEGKIKELRKKIEQIYNSDLPEVAKECAVKGIKKQIDDLLSQKGDGNSKKE